MAIKPNSEVSETLSLKNPPEWQKQVNSCPAQMLKKNTEERKKVHMQEKGQDQC